MSQVKIDLINHTQGRTQGTYSLAQFYPLALEVLNKFRIVDKVSIEILLVGENFIRNLNKKYRSVDKSTTVLSFPQTKNPQGLLGTIVLCPNKIEKEKGEKGTVRTVGFYFQWGFKNLLKEKNCLTVLMSKTLSSG